MKFIEMQKGQILELIKNGAKISIDTRTIQKGDVFFAINRGIDFVEEALSKGAIIAVIPDHYKQTPNKNLIFVPDTLKILLEIGEDIKLRSSARIIGITGSAGKTTTKFWLSELLSKHYSVTTGIKNYNTMYGLPICLSMIKPTDSFGIFELGTNNSGEIRALSEYLKPDVGIITNIMDSHIGRFGGRQALANEKISIINGIKPGGTIIFEGDSEFSSQIVEQAKDRGVKTISYGFGDNNDFVVRNYIRYYGNLRGHFDCIKTCIVAILQALELDLNNYLEYMKDLEPIDGRGTFKRFDYFGRKFTIIDDSYNASPSAVMASLNLLDNTKNYNKKIAILGEMKELGDFSIQYHTQVLEYLNKIHIDKVFFIGSTLISTLFKDKGITIFSEINNEIIKTILQDIKNNDIILLKGSNSIHLNKFVKFLENFKS